MSELFSDDAVLQHDDPVVGGNCTGGGSFTAVVVSDESAPGGSAAVSRATATCVAGRFLIKLPPVEPSPARYTIKVSSSAVGTEAATAERVMFGSVIVCG